MNYNDFIKKNKSGPVPRSKDEVKQSDRKDFDAKRNAIRRRLGNKGKPGSGRSRSLPLGRAYGPDEKSGITGRLGTGTKKF